ncbi:hypothetical protein [Actinophytocola sp.]|uniref:hypothetical protein n=1 Tax=Actinophytocola sp. TaxID=1872138 RepID=UPI002ED7EB4D
MNPRQPAADPAADAEWAGRVQRAATADVRQLLRTARRRRHARWLAGGLVVLAIAAVLTLLIRAGTFEQFFRSSAATAPQVQPTAAATATAPVLLDKTHPFESTPAQDWADGAAGIATPPPEAVGGFSAEQVAAATAQVRDVLVASRLDRRMVVDHDPSAYLNKLAPDAREQLRPLFSGGREPEVQSLVSLVSAGLALLPAQAKVDGEMKVTAGGSGELVVHTNYVFVYAFEPQGPTRLVDAMEMLVVVRADVDYVLRSGDRWTASSQGLWYGDAMGYAYSIGCDAYRKGYLAPASTERAVTANPAREPARYFDPASPLPATSGCPA